MPKIPVMTIENPGRDFEVVGMVVCRFENPKLARLIEESGVVPKLQEEAQKCDAHAVIGVRMYQFDNASVVGYGTAIRYK